MSEISSAQLRMCILDELGVGASRYIIPLAWRVDGALDLDALRRAVRGVAGRNESLRTRYTVVDGRPAPIVDRDPQVRVDVVDARHVTGEEALREFVSVLAHEPFRLAVDPVVRVHVVLAPDDTKILLVAIHHIAIDATSLETFADELSVLYSGFVVGEEPQLPDSAVDYRDFALWEREWLGSAEAARQLDYWREKLAGLSELELPVDRVRPAGRRPDGACVPVVLDRGLTAEVERLCRAQRVSSSMFLTAVFGVVLSRYAGQDDVALGTAVTGRGRQEFDGVVGLFLNTVVLRSRARGEMSFLDYLAEVREAALGAYENADVPFDRVVERLRPDRDASRNPLFQVMFVFDGMGAPRLRLAGARVEGFVVPPRSAQVDLTLELGVTGPGELGGQVIFATDLFEVSTVRRLVEHYGRVLRAVVGRPEIPLADIELMTPAERETAIELATGDFRPEPARLVHEAFADHAATAPARDAVIDGEVRRSYGELDRAANRLAHRLRELGVGLEKPVGVFLPRGERLVTAMLAVLKAGGVYLPLDPALPDDRVRYIVGDAGAGLVVTTSDLAPRSTGTPTLCLDVDSVAHHPATDAGTRVHPANLAYIIYTSGSTGRPKGTAVPHSLLANLVSWHTGAVPCTGVMLQMSAPNFDVFLQEVFIAWTSGAALELLQSDPRDIGGIRGQLADGTVRDVFFTPLILERLADELVTNGVEPVRLGNVVVGGDRLKLGDPIRRMMAAVRPRTFLNQYGPTETHVVTSSDITDLDRQREFPRIGAPIANTTTHVLDRHRGQVPAGLLGELSVGGAALARGYLGNPRDTALKFTPDPYGKPGGRSYATGDVVKREADGEVAFVGRIDQQVKIGGVRVEPGEVEVALLGHPDVRVALVVSVRTPHRGTTLVAFVQLESGSPGTTEADLRSFLSAKLPAQMVPSRFVEQDVLPLNASGKPDRATLRDLAARLVLAERVPVTSARFENETERKVAEVWAKILNAEHIGRDDDFFAIGGDSLGGMHIVAELRKIFRAEISIRTLFAERTVAALARVLGEDA